MEQTSNPRKLPKQLPIETTPSAYCANYKTPGLYGITEGQYYTATLISSKNEYLNYPCNVEVCVWEFGTNSVWITFTVQVIKDGGIRQGAPVIARGAVFSDVKPITK